MTESTDALPQSWRDVLSDLGVTAEAVESPRTNSDETTWFELYSSFATRGFVRGLAAPRDESTRFHLQFAIPAEAPAREVLEAIRAECRETVGGTWEIVAEDPDWELAGDCDEQPDRGSFSAWIARLEDLGRVAESGALTDAPWLAERLDTASSRESKQSTSAEAPAEDASRGSTSAGGAAADVFESIGDGSADESSSARLAEAGLESWEVMERDGGVEGRLQLDRRLPNTDREKLGRELAHALRSRYDIAARPLPAREGEDRQTELRLRAEPSESGLTERDSPGEIRSDMESYFDRLGRFDDLGVRLAAVLGLGESEDGGSGGRTPTRFRSGTSPSKDERVDAQKRGRGRREEETAPPSSGRKPRSRQSDEERDTTSPRATDREEEGVVLGVDPVDEPGETTTTVSSQSGLEPGNYRDPRLMREDATTSLVDIVLRHPGYAEEKMGHNLSILLDVDFPDAMELVEQAPSIIAWGVGRERALKFKRFIEDSGGKVVLVEPDSLTG